MLVLARKKEQKIQIGRNITVTILKVKGQSVHLGIEAPGDVRILRGEFVAEGPKHDKSATEPPDSADRPTADCAATPKRGHRGSGRRRRRRGPPEPGKAQPTSADGPADSVRAGQRGATNRVALPRGSNLARRSNRGPGPAFAAAPQTGARAHPLS